MVVTEGSCSVTKYESGGKKSNNCILSTCFYLASFNLLTVDMYFSLAIFRDLPFPFALFYTYKHLLLLNLKG